MTQKIPSRPKLVMIFWILGLMFFILSFSFFYIACTHTVTDVTSYSDTAYFSSFPNTGSGMTSVLNSTFGYTQDVLVRHVEMQPNDFLEVGFTPNSYSSSNGTVYVVLLQNLADVTDAQILTTSEWSLNGYDMVTYANNRGFEYQTSNTLIGIYLASPSMQNATFSVYTFLTHYGTNWFVYGYGITMTLIGAFYLSAFIARNISDKLEETESQGQKLLLLFLSMGGLLIIINVVLVILEARA